MIKTHSEEIIKELIQYMGGDIESEGLKDTPLRVLQSYRELCSGYKYSSDDIQVMMTQFDAGSYDELVILRDIEFCSLCEHHLLPFMGVAHVGYIPDRKVVGISKLARLLEVYSKRLQIQERICSDITNSLMTHLQPKGAACILEAKHLCISCRGVRKQNSVMVTSSMTGCIKEDMNCRQEFLRLIGK